MNYNNYTTKEDYLNYALVDLDIELKNRIENHIGEEHPSYAFISSIEKFIIAYHKTNYAFNGFKFERQIQEFKEGILRQIEYVLSVENINQKLNQNMVLSQADLERLGIEPSAIPFFRSAAMRNIRRG